MSKRKVEKCAVDDDFKQKKILDLKDSQEQTSVRFNDQNLFEVASAPSSCRSEKMFSLSKNIFFVARLRTTTTGRMQQSEEGCREKESDRSDGNICSVHVAKVRTE